MTPRSKLLRWFLNLFCFTRPESTLKCPVWQHTLQKGPPSPSWLPSTIFPHFDSVGSKSVVAETGTHLGVLGISVQKCSSVFCRLMAINYTEVVETVCVIESAHVSYVKSVTLSHCCTLRVSTSQVEPGCSD